VCAAPLFSALTRPFTSEIHAATGSAGSHYFPRIAPNMCHALSSPPIALQVARGLTSALLFVTATLTATAATPNIPPHHEDLLTMDNGAVKVGIDRAKKASITWLS
jgi:hypothetical protein